MNYDFLNMWFLLSFCAISLLLIDDLSRRKENNALKLEVENLKKAWDHERLSFYKVQEKNDIKKDSSD